MDIVDMRAGRAIRILGRLALGAVGAAAVAVLLAGCNEDVGVTGNARAFSPIPEATLQSMKAKSTDKNAPVLIRAFKKEAELEVWKQQPDGHYVYLKTFPMCRWSGQLGPKVREGDRQVPEGFYTVTPGSMNPNSAYFLSFNVGYPNAYDRAWGRTGGSIMVHGICSSAGCFSMTDGQIEEIYAIMREGFAGGQHAVQMQSFPFRMTAENMAKARLDPNIAFWRELKRGADEFEVTKMQVPVGVCNKHYVFAKAKGGGSFDAEAACPPLDLDGDVARALTDKEARDDTEMKKLVAEGVKPVRIVYQDGGQNPAFAHRFAEVSRPDAIAAAPTEFVLDDGPKAKPAAVQIAAARKAVGDGLDKPAPVVALASAIPAAIAPAPAAAKLPAKGGRPVMTASAAGAAKPGAKPAAQPDTTGSVPAAFAAAPSAYAKEEPKSAARSLFDRIMGGADAPAAEPAAAAPAAQASAPAAKVGTQASARKPGLDPTAVALSPAAE